MLEYFHADRLNYAVVGTPNRLEYDQGFFVKLGDGAADVKPIAHLYKTPGLPALAELSRSPGRGARPAADDGHVLAPAEPGGVLLLAAATRSMDLCLYAHNHSLPPEAVAPAVGLSVEDVNRVFRDIEQKRRATRYLHLPPILVEPVSELEVRSS